MFQKWIQSRSIQLKGYGHCVCVCLQRVHTGVLPEVEIHCFKGSHRIHGWYTWLQKKKTIGYSWWISMKQELTTLGYHGFRGLWTEVAMELWVYKHRCTYIERHHHYMGGQSGKCLPKKTWLGFPDEKNSSKHHGFLVVLLSPSWIHD